MNSAEPKRNMTGRHILIVEDELLLALDLQSIVEDIGGAVLGPASSIETALALLGDATPDAALLDVNLRGRRVTPVAKALKRRGIPFAMVTGYGRLEIGEPILQRAPRVRKPFNAEDIRAALVVMLDGSP